MISRIRGTDISLDDFKKLRWGIWGNLSTSYILPVPKKVICEDNLSLTVIIDIKIDSKHKVTLLNEFDKELNIFLNDFFTDVPGNDIYNTIDVLNYRIREIVYKNYHYVKVKHIDIEFIE